MQFLLTVDEYEILKERADRSIKTEDLQKLCTLAANHVPAQRIWDTDNTTPWGCVLDDETNPEYCDDCPVTGLCPHKGKRYSK